MAPAFDGCVCFAIPPKMFRRLVECTGNSPTSHRHMRHTGCLRSLRYEEHAKPPPRRRIRKVIRSVYDAAQREDLPGRLVRKEGGKPARDAAAEEAFDHAGIALAFHREVFGLDSIDGRGMPIVSTVHYGNGFPNAMWTGRQMVYGDGNDHVGGFTRALDIIAHELSHGITQHLVAGGLGVERVPRKEREFKEQRFALKGEAGALNESFSDICGSMVKQWNARQTVEQADWLLGQGILAPAMGRAVRSLRSPGNRRLTWSGDEQVKSMDDYHEGCDAHEGSGIPSHAFYRVALQLGGHSWEKAGPIWFDAYRRLTPKATFQEAAEATLAVAGERFGSASPERNAVHAAWRKVRVLR